MESLFVSFRAEEKVRSADRYHYNQEPMSLIPCSHKKKC